MGNDVQERIAKNNLLFRQANERIRATAHKYDDPLKWIPFLCECPRADCTTIVRLTAPEYQDVRANPSHFLAAPGHEQAEPSIGRVVSREENYIVVEVPFESRSS